MNKIISLASSAALMAMASLGAMAPASAAPNNMMQMHPNPGGQQQFVMNWCQAHPGDPSCHDFNNHGHHWSNNQYHSWYSSHHGQPGFDAGAAGLFGFAAGAIIAGAAASANASAPLSSDHVAACEQAYHSYQVRTDTYIGYDGARHQCML